MTENSITYGGADIIQFLGMAEPTVTRPERIVRSLRMASAGAPRVRLWAQQFTQGAMSRYGYDAADADQLVEDAWSDDEPADDLRTLARETAAALRAQSLDFSLSGNHADVVAEMTKDLDARAAELDAWADRPREDPLAKIEAEAANPWPTPLNYQLKHGAKNATFFLARRPWRALSSDGVGYTLRDGAWRETSDAELEAEVRATDPGDFLDVEHVSKVVKGVHQKSAVRAKPFDWIEPRAGDPAPKDLALFRNGLLDVTENRLIELDGRYFATGLPDHAWDPLAGCPTWMQWLENTLDPSFHPTLQEWFGYCLTPDVSAHKFAVLIGGPRSGKSTAHGVLHALVGAQHAASIMMPDLGGDFGLEALLDKRLAVVPDAHDAPARNRAAALERIKSVTGADPVSVNRKNRSIVTAVLPTRLLVTCNRLPRFIDESGALAARMLIVRFERSFLGKEDRGMPDRLRAEMPGIANWALTGLARLRENGLAFTVGAEGKAEVELASRSQSPAQRFAEDRLKVTGDAFDWTAMRTVHKAYTDWAMVEGVSYGETRSQSDLAQDLAAALPGVRYQQRRVEGKQTWGLTGIDGADLGFDVD